MPGRAATQARRRRAGAAMTAGRIVILIAVALLADQLTKAAALALLPRGAAVEVFSGLNLALGFNEGASFGLLSGIMAGRPLLMAALTGALTLTFAVMAFRARMSLERAGFALVVGGALGNIIDRLRQGAVTDFLDLYWRNWHWPTFNVADITITLGAVMVIAAAVPYRRRKEPVLDQP